MCTRPPASGWAHVSNFSASAGLCCGELVARDKLHRWRSNTCLNRSHVGRAREEFYENLDSRCVILSRRFSSLVERAQQSYVDSSLMRCSIADRLPIQYRSRSYFYPSSPFRSGTRLYILERQKTFISTASVIAAVRVLLTVRRICSVFSFSPTFAVDAASKSGRRIFFQAEVGDQSESEPRRRFESVAIDSRMEKELSLLCKSKSGEKVVNFEVIKTIGRKWRVFLHEAKCLEMSEKSIFTSAGSLKRKYHKS